MENKQKLPSKKQENIVDVSLSHITIGFAVFLGGTLLIGSTLIVVRDLSRYKRQKAILNGTLEIAKTILNKENKNA